MIELACHGLTLSVPGNGRDLVCDLSMALSAGEVVAIVGPNGAGKTTLVRALLGLVSPARGHVTLQGRPLDAWPRQQRSRRVAYLAQRPDFPHDMLVERVVGLGRVPHLPWHGGFGPADRQAVDDALVTTETAHLRTRGMLSLSGGEAQRVMLARLLCTQAAVLVLDEPTTALDLGHTFTLLEQCRQLADAGQLVVLSMHEVDLARRVADRVLCLHGDELGSFTWGPATEVLCPTLIERVFEIDVRLDGNQLVFGQGRLARG